MASDMILPHPLLGFLGMWSKRLFAVWAPLGVENLFFKLGLLVGQEDLFQILGLSWFTHLLVWTIPTNSVSVTSVLAPNHQEWKIEGKGMGADEMALVKYSAAESWGPDSEFSMTPRKSHVSYFVPGYPEFTSRCPSQSMSSNFSKRPSLKKPR